MPVSYFKDKDFKISDGNCFRGGGGGVLISVVTLFPGKGVGGGVSASFMTF